MTINVLQLMVTNTDKKPVAPLCPVTSNLIQTKVQSSIFSCTCGQPALTDGTAHFACLARNV